MLPLGEAGGTREFPVLILQLFCESTLLLIKKKNNQKHVLALLLQGVQTEIKLLTVGCKVIHIINNLGPGVSSRHHGSVPAAFLHRH